MKFSSPFKLFRRDAPFTVSNAIFAKIDESILEEKARGSAELWKQYPGALAPWLRDWAAANPAEVLSCQRDLWKARALGVQTPQLREWENKFAQLAQGFLGEGDRWKNVVATDIAALGGQGWSYQEQGGDSPIYYEIPLPLRELAPATSSKRRPASSHAPT